MSTTRIRLASFILVSSALLGGCGADDDASEQPTNATSSASSATDDAFRECLADQGVDLPEEGTTPDPSQLDPAAMQQAMEACGDLAPDGLLGGPDGASAMPDTSALRAFTQCLSRRDVEVEADLAAIQELDLTDRKVSRAFDACAPLIGQ